MTTLALPQATPAAPKTRDRRWIALAVVGIAQLMIILDSAIVNIALPHAQADLGISDADRQWVVTAYTLAFGGLLLLAARSSLTSEPSSS
jgi:MFS family permease